MERRMTPRMVPFTGYLAAALLMFLAPAAGEVTLLPTGTFEIVPGESSATFAVPDNRGGFSGRTTRVTGSIAIAPPKEGAEYSARIDAAIDTASLTTGNETRDASMRSEYLRTGEFPRVTFHGTAEARPGLGIRPFPAAVRGQLTIRGVTRDVEFPATAVALAEEYRADGTATVRMADFGIPYPRAFIFVARDPVAVTLHIRARRP